MFAMVVRFCASVPVAVAAHRRKRHRRPSKKLEQSPSELNRGGIPESALICLRMVAVGRRRRGWRFRMIFANVSWGRWWKARNAAAKRFGVSIASAVRGVARFKAKGESSPAPTGGDRRSGRIEAHRDYLLGLIRRRPDMTLLEMQERLIASCGERFSSSVLWRFFDRQELTFKKSPRTPRSSNARTF